MGRFALARDAVRSALPLAVPFVVTLAFIALFATAFPLTDEWIFTKAIVGLQGVDLWTDAGRAQFLAQFPARLSEHVVVVPFLIYWPIAELSHFDSRWFIFITLLCFAADALLLRRYLVPSTWWALPMALLLFCPSHYMEFLWGWQFTVALSIVLPLAGLVVLDGIPIMGPRWPQVRCVLGACALIVLGMLSSAGGFFGFPCGLLLLAWKPLRRSDKRLWLGVLAAATACAVWWMLQNGGVGGLRLEVQTLLRLLTMLGGTVWGTPVGPIQIEFDALSVTGFVILACAAAIVVRAALLGLLPRIALALCVLLFGLLCEGSIVILREGLGNYHLQYALLAPCGAYAAGYRLWRSDRTRFSAVPFFTLLVLLCASAFSYVKGFSEYGPNYNAYVRAVENYARNYLVDPDAKKPHPAGDVDAQMMLFLSAHDHPLFREPSGIRATYPLPDRAHVYLRGAELEQPIQIEIGGRTPERLTVVLPAEIPARVVLARIGSAELVLRRIHPRFAQVPGGEAADVRCYAGLLLPGRLPEGLQPVQLSFRR